MATIVPKGVSDPAAKGTTVKVADPVDEAISNALVTMHGISGGSRQQQLGPTIWTEVQFEGSPVKALVDTGSPATIEVRFESSCHQTTSRSEPSRVGHVCTVSDAAAHCYATELQWRHTECCAANDGSAEQGRQTPSGFGVHPGRGTRRPAVRYRRTSSVGILSSRASGRGSISGLVFW